MAKKWYVVHTYSGYEHKVKAALEERIRALGKEEFFGDILVPAEKVVELVKGKPKTSSRKFFPGYILVNMELNDETWHVVKSTPKVTGFVGGATEPPSISETEVRRDRAADGGGRGPAEAEGVLRDRRERQGRSTGRSRTSTASSRK